MTPTIVRGTLVSFDPTTYTALVMLDGSLAEVSMPVLETVPKNFLTADDQVAVLLFQVTNYENGVILGPFGAVAGLLAITGTPTDGQVPIGRASDGALVLAAITGTANQVVVTNGAASITLSLPQSIHTAADPTFDQLSLTNYLQHTEIAAPGTPAGGFLRWYADSTQSWGYFINDAGKAVPVGAARLFFGPADFTLTVATTGLAGTNNRVIVFAVTGTANQAEQNFPLPPGWAGRTLTAKLWWSPSNNNTGNVEFTVALRRVAEGVALPSAATVSNTILAAGPGVIDQVRDDTCTLALSGFSEGDAVGMRITRIDTAANDTFTGSAQVSAVELSVVG